jgi:hypothetical protein
MVDGIFMSYWEANRRTVRLLALTVVIMGLLWGWQPVGSSRVSAQQPVKKVRFAVIGDYGLSSPSERAVATLVAGWQPDFVITVGDNNYPVGSAASIDQNVGQYYHNFIAPYTGHYDESAQASHAVTTTNRFFPTLGNHDWRAAHAKPYFDYFTLPGNERYYDFVRGPVHFFALDSDPSEPDGIGSQSVQAMWLRDRLNKSTAPWKIVYLHHPPFSSGPHGSNRTLQWPFQQWGATAILSGHDHVYERIVRNGLPYFVNGLGGSITYDFGQTVSGSQARYNADFGAMLVEATAERITFQFITRKGKVIDTYRRGT